MALIPLCDKCSQIDLSILRAPSRSELANALKDDPQTPARFLGTKNNSLFPKTSSIEEMIILGTLSRIERDASYCSLCSVIAKTISRQGGNAYGLLGRCFDLDLLEHRTSHAFSYIFNSLRPSICFAKDS